MSTNSENSTARTESVLSGLATAIQPRRVITVGTSGAGITLSRALESSVSEFSPRLWSFTVDRSDSDVEDFVRANRPRFDFVESVDDSVFDLPLRYLRDIGPFDLVWIESDSLVTDARSIRTLWPHVAAGGVLAVANSFLPAEANPLWNALLRFCTDGAEALTIPTSEVGDRTGTGLIKKRSESLREVNFTDEMVALTGVPVRFESIGVHADGSLLDRATSVLHVLADPNLRAVLFAVGSGISTLDALRSHTALPSRAIHKAVARLFALSVVARVDDRLVIDQATFESFRELPRTAPPPTEMSRYSRDRPQFLNAIARQLSSTTWSSEHQVNELCTFFDDDYATLRRELVDTGYLERNSAGSMYRARE